MIAKTTKWFFCIVVFIVLPASVFSQFSTLESFGTKSNSLANISTTFKDINASYTNQAGLAFINGLEINMSYENRFLALDLSAINFAVAKNFNKIGTFGLSIKKFGISEYSEFLFGLAYARKLNNSTGIAVQLNAYNLSIENYGTKNAISFETGIIHDFSKRFTLGFHVSNPFPIKYLDEVNIPTIVTLGARYKASDNIVLFAEVEKHINYGTIVKTAIEYNPITVFSIYIGYKNDFNGTADISTGFMYIINNKIKLNLGTTYNITLGLSPSIGISYALNNKLTSN